MVPDFVGQIFRLGSSIAGGAVVPSVLYGLVNPGAISLRSFLGLAVVVFLVTLIADFVSVVFVRRMWARGKMRSRAVILGSGTLARELAVELRMRPEYGVDLVGVFEPENADFADELINTLARLDGDRLIIAPLGAEAVEGPALVTAARAAIALGVPTYVVPRLYEMGLGLDSLSPDRARGYPLVRVQRSAHPSLATKGKRFFDVVASGIVLLATVPILLPAMLLIRVSSRGPILFRQPRVGQGGQTFDMLKLRSMTVSDNEHSERSSSHRVTAVGRFLRATAIDELPQLWNVLRGDMSIVGPRPERLQFVEEGLTLFDGYRDRHRMPMGMTGLAQIAGLRGEDTSVQERVKFDNLYIDQWTFFLDVQILLKTLFAVVLQTRYRRRERELAEALVTVNGWKLQHVIDFPTETRLPRNSDARS
jgi:exopolysaccharide biosynthesis polyprenyl glycosylphosphotransferase